MRKTEKKSFENKWILRTIWYALCCLFTEVWRWRCDEERLILRSPLCDLVSSSTCLMITLKRFSLCLSTCCSVETWKMQTTQGFFSPTCTTLPAPLNVSSSLVCLRLKIMSRHANVELQLFGPFTNDGQKLWVGAMSGEWSFSSFIFRFLQVRPNLFFVRWGTMLLNFKVYSQEGESELINPCRKVQLSGGLRCWNALLMVVQEPWG